MILPPRQRSTVNWAVGIVDKGPEERIYGALPIGRSMRPSLNSVKKINKNIS
jgi:hypothetical protein